MTDDGSVLLIGIPSEPPLALTARALGSLGRSPLILNQRRLAETRLELSLEDGALQGELSVEGKAVDVGSLRGIYARPMDHRLLPELEGLPSDHPARRHADRLHEGLCLLCEVSPSRVVNRLSTMRSNNSKPFQAQLIARRFPIPETLVTDDPQAAIAFAAEHGRVVFKSISGVRSIVRELTGPDLERLGALRGCPVQLQRYVDGCDLRVHTLADGTFFATRISSGASDWRYPRDASQAARMAPAEIDDRLAQRCLALAGDLGLAFAGIDLRVGDDGEAYCLEVNPSSAFSAFEEPTGQPIASALAAYLAG